MKALPFVAPTPTPTPIRHLVGMQLLLIVEAVLVLCSATVPGGPLRAIIVISALLALAGLIAAIRGEPEQDPMEESRS